MNCQKGKFMSNGLWWQLMYSVTVNCVEEVCSDGAILIASKSDVQIINSKLDESDR